MGISEKIVLRWWMFSEVTRIKWLMNYLYSCALNLKSKCYWFCFIDHIIESKCTGGKKKKDTTTKAAWKQFISLRLSVLWCRGRCAEAATAALESDSGFTSICKTLYGGSSSSYWTRLRVWTERKKKMLLDLDSKWKYSTWIVAFKQSHHLRVCQS